MAQIRGFAGGAFLDFVTDGVAEPGESTVLEHNDLTVQHNLTAKRHNRTDMRHTDLTLHHNR